MKRKGNMSSETTSKRQKVEGSPKRSVCFILNIPMQLFTMIDFNLRITKNNSLLQ